MSNPTDPGGADPVPGWYPDPQPTGGLRWWDGTKWTEHVQPLPPAPGSGPYPPGMVGSPTGGWHRVDVDTERRNGQAAQLAVKFGVVAYAVTAAVSVVIIHEFMAELQRLIDAGDTNTQPQFASTSAGLSALSNLTSIVTIVVGIVVLIWFHRAASNAEALGLPQRRSPGWAVGGFILPIVNFWFPYQSACDFFPPGSPDRKLVGRWWAFWLSAQLSSFVVFAAGIVSLEFGLVLVAAQAVLYLMAAQSFVVMVDRAIEVHTDLRTLASGAAPGGPWPGAMPSPGGPTASGPGPRGPVSGGSPWAAPTPPPRPPSFPPMPPQPPSAPPSPPQPPWGPSVPPSAPSPPPIPPVEPPPSDDPPDPWAPR
jgi:hypothetical protein